MTAVAGPRIPAELGIAAALSAAAIAGYALAAAGAVSLQPAPGLYGTLDEFTAIAARNTAVALLFVGAAHVRPLRRRVSMLVVDTIGLGILLPVTLLVGVYLAAPGGWRYFVHAPLELAALGGAYAWWWSHHESDPPAASNTLRRALIITLALTIAAAIETFLVPHRVS